MVAPDREQSGTSHSLTLHRPLRATLRNDGAYQVDGTPTDCVLLALGALMPDKPDFVISGVNHGPNMGEDVLYSGTVAAAFEGLAAGIPSVAVSFGSFDLEHLSSYRSRLQTTGLPRVRAWIGVISGVVLVMSRIRGSHGRPSRPTTARLLPLEVSFPFRRFP